MAAINLRLIFPDKNKFLTTFNEKASAKNPIALRPPPHELRKFQDLRILDIAAGLYHILLFAVSKTSASNSFDTSSDPNENIPVRTWPDRVDQKRSVEVKHQSIPDFKNIISAKPVLARETLQAIQPTEKGLQLLPIQETIVSKAQIPIVNQTPAEAQRVQTDCLPEPSERVETRIDAMDIVTKNVSSIGDSLMHDIKSIASTGEGMLNDLAKETEKTIKEVPKNVIDYVKSSISPDHGMDNDDNVMKIDKVKESAAKEMPKDIDSSHPPMQTDHHNNKLNRAFAEDDSNETVADDMVNNEVKFINNGVDVSSTSDIIQAMNDEIHEMSNGAKNKADELTMKYDGIMNDDLTAAKEAASAKLFEMKNGKLMIVRANRNRNKSPNGHRMQLFNDEFCFFFPFFCNCVISLFL